MTDTNQASELYELCKKVYELTSWKDTRSRLDDGNHTIRNEGNEVLLGSKQVPLYTSDYLLEKLPNELKRSDDQYGALWGMKNLTQMLDGVWDASYRFEDEMNPPDYKYSCESDTPLKSLLKLTIALSEAGELK